MKQKISRNAKKQKKAKWLFADSENSWRKVENKKAAQIEENLPNKMLISRDKEKETRNHSVYV